MRCSRPWSSASRGRTPSKPSRGSSRPEVAGLSPRRELPKRGLAEAAVDRQILSPKVGVRLATFVRHPCDRQRTRHANAITEAAARNLVSWPFAGASAGANAKLQLLTR